MIGQDVFEACVRRAALAPTVHNTQPARWRRDGDVLSLFCDTDVGLTVGDPTGRDAALSCGAVLEGMVLALSAHSIAVSVTLTRSSTAPGQGLVALAHFDLLRGEVDGLHHQLERRFTWRGAFSDVPVDVSAWERQDTRLILDMPSRAWLADHNDKASFAILQNAAFRRELVHWMRLQDHHPRAGLDGMDRAALNMSRLDGFTTPWALIRFWRILDRFGITRSMTSEADVTLSSPAIALLYINKSEGDVTAGRAYLRMCLEAASYGLAGWPMAALSDHRATNAKICDRFDIPANCRLVQAIRFGVPTGPASNRARRPLNEVIC